MSTLGRYITWTSAAEGGHRRRLGIPYPRLTGVAWLAWRRHRGIYRTGGVLLMLAVLGAIWARYQLVAAIHTYADCGGAAPRICSVDKPIEQGSRVSSPPVAVGMFNHSLTALSYVPVAVGALIGGPLFAQDLESGAHRLAWTQSVDRRLWARGKLAVAVAAVTLGATALSAAMSWWWLATWQGQHDSGRQGAAWRYFTSQERWDFFAVTGPVAVAHALLALLIGATAGLLARRTLPAVALGAVVSEGALIAADGLRAHLLPPVIISRVGGIDPLGYIVVGRAAPDTWRLHSGFVRADGSLLSQRVCDAGFSGAPQCLSRAHVVGTYSSYQPMSHFPRMQGIETGICLAATAGLAAFCVWKVTRIAS